MSHITDAYSKHLPIHSESCSATDSKYVEMEEEK